MSIIAINKAFACHGISAAEQHVLLAMADYADNLFRCYPSLSTLAKKTNRPKRSIIRYLKSLEEKGYIKKYTTNDSLSNHYHLLYCLNSTAKQFSKQKKSKNITYLKAI